jgi:hypothetical protein
MTRDGPQRFDELNQILAMVGRPVMQTTDQRKVLLLDNSSSNVKLWKLDLHQYMLPNFGKGEGKAFRNHNLLDAKFLQVRSGTAKQKGTVAFGSKSFVLGVAALRTLSK